VVRARRLALSTSKGVDYKKITVQLSTQGPLCCVEVLVPDTSLAVLTAFNGEGSKTILVVAWYACG
jgi:hypothetical protein